MMMYKMFTVDLNAFELIFVRLKMWKNSNLKTLWKLNFFYNKYFCYKNYSSGSKNRKLFFPAKEIDPENPVNSINLFISKLK